MTRGRRAGPWRKWCPVLVAFALCLQAPDVRAEDPRNAYLIKLLQGSSQFRVRAQAAISLGAVESSSTAVSALTAALGDAHPAVRAAAANSLGRIGSSTAVAALRRLERDPEEPVRSAATAAIAKLTTSERFNVASTRSTPTPEVPSGPPRYYVSVAQPGSRVSTIDRKALSSAQSFIKQRVGQIDGVMLAPDGENNQAADRVLKQKNLKGFYLDSSIVSVEKKSNGGTRVAVSVIVATYPGRDMRAIMQGAATVSGGGGDAYIQALEGALSGALRQLPQALAR